MELKRWLWGTGVAFGVVGVAAWVTYGGGHHMGPGAMNATGVPAPRVAARAAREASAVPAEHAAEQILFGDFHVHTTYSADAFMRSLPPLAGEGAHPPADACDFARFCSQLDFFSLNDHAEALTPAHWQEEKDSVRQCNAVAGQGDNPDLVAFAGFEWSQVGLTPETHYGHKNVIFRDTDEAHLPSRPIAAPGMTRTFNVMKNAAGATVPPMALPVIDFANRNRYMDIFRFQREVKGVDACPSGVDVHKLPASCREFATTPSELFEKLAEWGFDSIVIPHGTTWGFYTPPGYTWDKQLAPDQGSDRQQLIEVYSGHGNSEEYRPWRAVTRGAKGEPVCPAPTPGYEPCCWRAGEIIRARCGNASKAECEQRVRDARQRAAAAGVAYHYTVPGASVADWGDCGQCRDCFDPAYDTRPGGSVQYVLARGWFKDGKARHARFGFIASSDNHTARPGTGYKEFNRHANTETVGAKSEVWRDRIFGKPEVPTPESRVLPPDALDHVAPFQLVYLERQVSFFMTGGLVAVHSEGRSRDAIWKALKARDVYGTSGDRILLWFDLLDGPEGKPRPMGAEVALGTTPRFRVRAVGAFKQKPGCPAWTASAISQERLQRLCFGECYNPGDERKRITRIEVVRIRPQVRENEPIAPLIEDVWKTLECHDAGSGCTAEFDDPEFTSGARDAAYYVRAVEEASPAVNAGGLRCERDAQGNCKKPHPCYGDYRTSFKDDCLSPNEERAWSSPIFVDFAGGAR